MIKSLKEMKKILLFVLSSIFCIFNAGGAVRDENTVVRGKNNVITTQKPVVRSISNRSAVKKTVSARTNSGVSVLKSRSSSTPAKTARTTATRTSVITARRANVPKQNVSARAATQAGNVATDTRTGLAYEQCKTAFFTCMDQFCELKNDKFKRCSCNDRVFKYQDVLDNYQEVSEHLTEFKENLDAVGLTKEQATSMKTASEGEDALTEDKSASKQLLQAIMNAIKGEDSSVGGKYKNLNSLVISPDMSNAFGMNDYGQVVAAYNGTNLYKAVYPKCRTAVKDDCNDASLQRAVNAYLMAIEQDCNTVESALTTTQKTLRASTYEGSAMLDLARVENRQKHNADDVATCLVNVETAIQSEEVCGAGYHKCLDNGQYIDIVTGAPLTGVKDFYKLGTLLTFKNNENIQNQKLSTLSSNQQFVNFFESKTKKFAKDALDRCTEKSDQVWREYLDRALLDIYYAQQSKVKTIQDSCLSLVAACYDNQNTAIKEAMANLTGDYTLTLEPATINLTNEMCSDYIESCNNMFVTMSGDVVKQYMQNKIQADSETACRAIVQKCFDGFGGPAYENFYYKQNGLFASGKAIEWFTLYNCSSETGCDKTQYVSQCAKELANTPGCQDTGMIERVFGGLDKYEIIADWKYAYKYINPNNPTNTFDRNLRPHGVASEVYSKIIDTLSVQCEQLGGYFVEPQYAQMYGYEPDSFCNITRQFSSPKSIYEELNDHYHFVSPNNGSTGENMCPAGYKEKIDVQSWGACSCWENGNYRSKNGTIARCRPLLRVLDEKSDSISEQDIEPLCSETLLKPPADGIYTENKYTKNLWCQQNIKSSKGQICPYTKTSTNNAEDILTNQVLHNDAQGNTEDTSSPKTYCASAD